MVAHHCECAKCPSEVDHLLFCEFHLNKKQKPFAAMWTDLEMIILSDVSQTDKDKYHMISLTCGILKSETSDLIYKTETNSRTSKTNLQLPNGKGGEG